MPYALKIALLIVAVIVLDFVMTALVVAAQLKRRAGEEAIQVLNSAKNDQKEIIREEDLAQVPAPVQKWLRRSGVIGKEKIHSVRLLQAGRMRTAPGKNWMNVEAEQYINIDEPGFVWKPRVQYAPFIKLLGMDKYYQGRGSMELKLLALVPVVEAQPGVEMDQGALLRFLAEMIWYPTAALHDYIVWEEIDENSARAIMTWEGVSAGLVFHFNEAGDMVSSVGPRYREEKGQFILDDWGGIARSYREFKGMRIVNQCDVVWKYKSGDFNWLQLEVTALEYNQEGLFAAKV